MTKVLLHICCGICASWPIEKLRQDGFDVTGYFYNPNIYPEAEYRLRLAVCEEVCRLFQVPLILGEYDHSAWSGLISGMEQEPEGGRRCEACYRMRIQQTWEKARETGSDHITTTLSVSPHKNAGVINRVGKEVCAMAFLENDFKKQNGFKKTNAFSKEHDLYRQHYCGCMFSKQRAK